MGLTEIHEAAIKNLERVVGEPGKPISGEISLLPGPRSSLPEDVLRARQAVAGDPLALQMLKAGAAAFIEGINARCDMFLTGGDLCAATATPELRAELGANPGHNDVMESFFARLRTQRIKANGSLMHNDAGRLPAPPRTLA